MKYITSVLVIASILAFVSCTPQQAEQEETKKETKEQTAAPTLPEGLFLAEAPEDAASLAEVRANAKPGDKVAFTGYIGGRVEPFTDGRAIFLMADAEGAPACIPEHACETPWDACCEPSDIIAANSATVQVVDGEGKILHVGMNGINGLEPGASVTVVGTVRDAGESILIVDASGIATR